MCLQNGTAQLAATVGQPALVLPGFNLMYILTKGAVGQIVGTSATPNFTATEAGDFKIHAFVYGNWLSINDLQANYANIFDLNEALIQGGGANCGALDVAGAAFVVETCDDCAEPVVAGINLVKSDCGRSIGRAEIMVVGNLNDFQFAWSPNIGSVANAAGNYRIALPAGSYAVTVSRANQPDCQTVVNFVIDNADGPAVTIASLEAATCNLADGKATLAPANLLYAWSSGGGGFTRSNLAAGHYVVTATDPATNCFSVIEFDIEKSSPLTASATNLVKPDCGQANGAATISVAGGSGSYTFGAWGTTATRTNLTAGNYTLTVTDAASGCTATLSFVLENEVLGAANISLANSTISTTCAGANNATLVFDTTFQAGFVRPATLKIEDADGHVFQNGSLAPGNYCLLVFDGNNCLAGQSCFTVVEPAPLEVSVEKQNATCAAGGSIALTVSGGTPNFTFNWNPASAGTGATASNLAAGNYAVTVTDANACSLTINDLAIADGCNCTADAGNLTLVNATLCLVNGAANVQANLAGATVPPGFQTAFVVVSQIGQTVVQVATQPQFDVAQAGNFTVLPLVFNPATFNLSSIQAGTTTASDINAQLISGGGQLCGELGLPGASLMVNNCPPTSCAAPVVASVQSTDAACGQSTGAMSVNLSGNPADFNFAWSAGGSTSATASGLAAGVYTVTITVSGDTCSTTVTRIIGNTDGPVASIISTSAANCGASDGQAIMAPAAYQFDWPTGADIRDRHDLAAGTYFVTVTDATTGCTDVIEVVIEQQNDLEVEAVITQKPLCGATNGTVNLTVTGGSGSYSYLWNGTIQTTVPTLPNVAAGSFSVKVTDMVTGCVTTIEFAVPNDVAPAFVHIVSTQHLTCTGANDGQVTFTDSLAAGFVLPATALIQNAAGQTFTNGQLPVGDYCILVFDGNNCLAGQACFTIAPLQPLAVQVSKIDQNCDQNGSIQLVVTGGNAPYSFKWNDGPTTQNRVGLLEGIYTATVTDAAGCSQIVANIAVQNTCTACFPPEIASLSVVKPDCGDSTGLVTIDMVGDDADYVFNWGNAPGTPNLLGNVRLGLPAGAYAVTISRVNEPTCNTVENVLIGSANFPTIAQSTFPANCGSADGQVVLQPFQLEFAWPDGQTTAFRSDLAAGTYVVTATDPATQCVDFVEITIGETSPMFASPFFNQLPACGQANGSATIEVQGGSGNYAYFWTADTTLAGPAQRDDLAAGAYSVLVKDLATGCTATAQFVLTNSGLAQAQITAPAQVAVSCVGSTDGEISWTLNLPQNFLAPATVEIVNAAGTVFQNGSLKPGNYVLLVKNADGCVAGQRPFTVAEPTNLNVQVASTDADCDTGGSLTLAVSGGNAPYSFAWLGSASTSGTRTDLASGLYYATITDANGCATTLSNLAVGNNCPDACSVSMGTVTFATDTLCIENGSAQIVAQIDNQGTSVPAGFVIRYVLSHGNDLVIDSVSAVPVFQVTEANVYHVHPIVFDTNSMNLNQTLLAVGTAYALKALFLPTGVLCGDLNLSTPPVFVKPSCAVQPPCQIALDTILITNSTCNASTGAATVVMEPGATYSFQWPNGVTANGATATNLAAGAYTVQVADVTDPTCHLDVLVVIGNSNGPAATASVTAATCGSANGAAALNPLNFNYIWDDGSTLPVRTGLVARTYAVTVSDPNNAGCSNVIAVTVPNLNPLAATPVINQQPKCGLPTGSVTVNVTGGSGTYLFSWGSSNPTFSFFVAGDYTVTVVDNAIGCTTTASFTLTDQNPTAQVQLGIQQPLCEGTFGNAEVSIANPSANFAQPPIITWLDAVTLQPVFPTVLTDGTYEVRVADGDGCPVFSQTFEIISPDPVSATFTTTQACPAQGILGSATITASGGRGAPYSFNWSDAPGTSQPATRTGLAAGTYTVTVADRVGCTSLLSVTILEDVNCAPLDVCDLNAGTLTANAADVCLDTLTNTATISAIAAGQIVEPGYLVKYVLVKNGVFQQLADIPLFTVADTGAYSLHTLIYHPDTLDLAANLQLGTTTVAQFLAAIANQCTELGLPGAAVLVKNCTTNGCLAAAGNLVPVNASVCKNPNGATTLAATHQTQPTVPTGFETRYLLVRAGVILEVKNTSQFALVGAPIGAYTIHTLVFDPTNFNINSIQPGATLVTTVLQQLGNQCFALDLNGAAITLKNCACEAPVASAIVTDAKCGNASGVATLEIQGDLADFVLTVLQGDAVFVGNEAANLLAGNYVVRVAKKSDADCFVDVAFAVGNSDGPQAEVLDIQPATCLASNGAAALDPEKFDFQWINSASGATFSGAAVQNVGAGSYFVTVTDPDAPDCQNFLVVNIPADNPLNVDVTLDAPAYCGQPSGVATLAVTGGSGVYVFSWGNGPQRTDLSPGTYTVTVVDQSLTCQDSITFTIENNQPTGVLSIQNVAAPTCAGVDNGSVTFAFQPGATFTNQPIFQIKRAGDPNTLFDANSLPPGVFVLEVSDATGCQITNLSFTVPQPQGLQVAVQTLPATCTGGGSANATVTGGSGIYTYLWSNMATDNALVGLAPGVYTVTVNDANGCSAVQTATVANDCQAVPCQVSAGTIEPLVPSVCLDNQTVTIAAVSTGTSGGPGYQTVYLLSQNGVVFAFSPAATFTVNSIGNYAIHTFLYHPDSLNFSTTVVPGTTTVAQLNGLLQQGGGQICAAMTVQGAAIAVVDCTGGCPNPPQIADIQTLNSTCGNSTGSISIDMVGGTQGLTFVWSPGVSTTNAANGIAAGTYQIEIFETANPACKLDTSVIVSNSDGPQVQIASVTPTQCLASNGAAVLAPANLDYVWDNGESGATNDGLLGRCYTVTATDPATGCFSILQVCIPTANPLANTFAIVEHAKCGLGTGVVDVTTTGGSGQYSYSLGTSSQLTGLFAGLNVCIVTDNLTGCQDTISFTLDSLGVEADIALTKHDITCFGQNNGFVEFVVNPGANFALPFTFELRDSDGDVVGPANMRPDTYVLQVTDADGCALKPDTFQIVEPAQVVVLANVINQNCASGGQINLSVTGGTGNAGSFRFDWDDLTGSNDPQNRTNLGAGLYSVIAFDSLGCSDTLANIAVLDDCQQIDTVYLVLPVTTTDSLCVGGGAGATYTLVGGGTGGLSTFGSWTVNANGCLVYTAGNTPGFGVDTICVITTTPLGTDTTCIIVSITPSAVTTDTIPFTVQVNSAATACGNIPASIQNPVITLLNGGGLAGSSLPFGTYTINDTSACITFSSLMLDGWNVDTICVSVCDTVSGQCHIICYIPSVLPFNPCLDTIIAADSLHFFTNNCAAGAAACLDIPYQEIVNYTILDNGLPYAGGYLGCDVDTMIAYSVLLLPGGGQPVFGPYTLNEWKINGVTYSGTFTDLTGLVNLMNQLDPVPGWSLQNQFFLVGGNTQSDYGALRVTSVNGVVGILQPNTQLAPNGTEMRFSVGTHKVIFKHVQTGCADSLTVVVECVNCPPLHDYGPQPVFGYQFPLDDCNGDTVFNTLILASELPNYTITDLGVPFTNTTVWKADTSLCYNYFALPGQGQAGPFTIDSWDIDGVILPGTTVSNVDGILSFLNSNDPAGGPWTKDATLFNLCTSNWKQHDYNSITLSQAGTPLAVLEPVFKADNALIGFVLDTGYHQIRVINNVTTCDSTLVIYVDCPKIPVVTTLRDTIMQGTTDVMCLDTTFLASPIVSVTNVCPGSADGNIHYFFDQDKWCVTFTGLEIGDDSLCIQLCNAAGNCAIYNLYVTVVPSRDTLELTVKVGTSDTICLNTTGLVVTTIVNDCPDASGAIVDFSVIPGTSCVIFDALTVGADTACVVYCWEQNNVTVCDTTILIINSVTDPTDTIRYTIPIGVSGQEEWCVPLNQFIGDVTITEICGLPQDNALWEIDEQSDCVTITGVVPGADTLCLEICDQLPHCVTVVIIANVIDVPGDTLIAVPNDTITTKNTAVSLDIIANDTILGLPGNLAGVKSVTFSQPRLGTVQYNPATGVLTYTPLADSCGVDKFFYVLEDTRGNIDTALVTVTILCDKLLIYNGISPNGDGLNETWRILGIDAFPRNEVQVFNRWGNLVFHKKGYNAQEEWDGTWRDNKLPDGTYFYMINLNDPSDPGAEPLTGYLQILR
ncbi:MAG: gliding motility-associated C-terminal domain-containing protein [Saprospiraceae bacterium]